MSGVRYGVIDRSMDDAAFSPTIRAIVAMALSLLALASALAAEETATSVQQAGTLMAGFLGVLVAAWKPTARAGGAAFLYFVVFALFHAGLVVAFAARGESAFVGGGDNSWITPTELGPAVELVAIGTFAATCGVLLGGLSLRRPLLKRFVAREDIGRLPLAGTFAALVGAALAGYSVFTNGGLAADGGYIELLEVVDGDQTFSYGTLLLGLGLSLMVAAGGRTRRWGWSGMIVVALIALPLGLRGPVLFPLITMVMIEAKRRPLRLWIFAIVSVGVLGAISVIRQTRSQGISGLLDGGWTRIDPLDGAAEMGYSIYPVVQVERWMSSGVEPMNGVTFIAPVVRTIERWLGFTSPPGAEDFRLFNVEIFARVGPIGGSPIAEGYRNFGVVGVILVMLILGYVLSKVDGLPSTPAGGALAAVLMLPLITAVRNSFAPVLPQVLIGAIVVFVAFAGARRRQ